MIKFILGIIIGIGIGMVLYGIATAPEGEDIWLFLNVIYVKKK